MKTYTFKVQQIDKFVAEIKIDANSEEEANQKLRDDLEQCPIDTRSNTLQSSETITNLK